MGIHWIDVTVFIIYLLTMMVVGFYFLRRNSSDEDYYVGGRNLNAGHVGLSVVATDVGGGFSIGLGGLGFAMGISGNWMLFTGLLGAWISSVFLIPRIYNIAHEQKFLSFPQVLGYFYNKKVAFIAGFISLIGYIGFTSSQILAGAKLASATFPTVGLEVAILIMGIIAVAYTTVGGIKAVIYTDTIQWLILIVGLCCIGIPIGYFTIGGWEGITENLKPEMLSLTNLSFVQFFNWLLTIVPIWFVGMTLYQRIYACRDEKTAKRAWRIAGLFEWPVMAFMGVILGMFARVAFDQGLFSELGFMPDEEIDAELGLPLFISHILPVGLMGLMMSAYFSAIMSTADSCLMAASGNLLTDILGNGRQKRMSNIRFSQLLTLFIGVVAIILATSLTSVLEMMLYSYAFMVSGLLVPVLGMLVLKKPSPVAALTAMIFGGLTTLILIALDTSLPFGLDPNFFGILLSVLCFMTVQFILRK